MKNNEGPGGILLGVFLLSIATLCFELLQTRILSVIHWNHLVYLTVTIALLGFGISGAFVSIYSRRLMENYRFYLSLFSLLFALAVGVSFLAIISIIQVQVLKASQMKMLLSYLILTMPFFFAGAALVLSFKAYAKKINVIYFINLVGSGLGCAVFIVFIQPLSGPGMVFFVSFLGLLAALAFMKFRFQHKALFGLTLLFIPVSLVLMYFGNHLIYIKTQNYKYLARAFDEKNHPDAVIESSTWTPLSRIDVASDKKNLLSWKTCGWIKSPADFKLITIDGDAFSLLASKRFIHAIYERIQKGEDDLIWNLVYQVKKNPEVMIIGVGGGYDVYAANGYGAKKITGVEINKEIYRLTTKKYIEYNGNEINQDHIKIFNAEGRSFVRRTKDRFDVIQIHAIDTFAALSSGAYVLSENYLYTVEAFKDFFDHLKSDGILSIQRHHFDLPRETLRLAALGVEAYQDLGVPETAIQKSMFVGSFGHHGLILFKKSAFTPGETRMLLEACRNFNFIPLYIPKVFPFPEQEQWEQEAAAFARTKGGEEAGRIYNQLITAGSRGEDREAFYDSYRFNVTPVYDNMPFFYEWHKGADWLKKLTFSKNRGVWPPIVLIVLLILSLLCTLILIIVPLWIKRKGMVQHKGNGGATVYFCALGLGFMFVEIGLMQKLSLYLGHPIYSIALVLTVLLMATGIGSYCSGLLKWQRFSIICFAVTGISALIVIYIFLFEPLFAATLGLSIVIRILISGFLVLLLGFFMGMPFPQGLSIVESHEKFLLPWAWGVNGAASVLASIVCVMAAMRFGFNVVFAVSILVYAASLLGMRGFLRAKAQLSAS